MDIGTLHDVRAIVLSPLTGSPELAHPDDLDPLIESYGPLPIIGTVGMSSRVCLTLRGPLVHETPEIQTIEGQPLPAGVHQQLLHEYSALTHDAY